MDDKILCSDFKDMTTCAAELDKMNVKYTIKYTEKGYMIIVKGER